MTPVKPNGPPNHEMYDLYAGIETTGEDARAVCGDIDTEGRDHSMGDPASHKNTSMEAKRVDRPSSHRDSSPEGQDQGSSVVGTGGMEENMEWKGVHESVEAEQGEKSVKEETEHVQSEGVEAVEVEESEEKLPSFILSEEDLKTVIQCLEGLKESLETARHTTVRHSHAHMHIHNTTQHNTTQHNTTQHNTTQHNTRHMHVKVNNNNNKRVCISIKNYM